MKTNLFVCDVNAFQKSSFDSFVQECTNFATVDVTIQRIELPLESPLEDGRWVLVLYIGVLNRSATEEELNKIVFDSVQKYSPFYKVQNFPRLAIYIDYKPDVQDVDVAVSLSVLKSKFMLLDKFALFGSSLYVGESGLQKLKKNIETIHFSL